MQAKAMLGALALLAAPVLGACADDGTSDAAGTTTTTLDPSWAPPGTEIGLGLTVPEDAFLAGTVFRRPQLVMLEEVRPVGDELEALLVVGRDPFALFDAVAAQARALGAEVSGSATSCEWWHLGDRGTTVEEVGSVTGPELDDEISALHCEAAGRSDAMSVALELHWGDGLPGTLVVTAGAYETDLDLAGLTGEGPADPDPAPAGAAALLPDPAPREEPEPGDEFGGRLTCLTSGAERLHLPDGARLVATAGTLGLVTVLASDDAEATMAALVEDARGAKDDHLEVEDAREVVLADGSTVWSQSVSVSGGGGACEMHTSPDGRHVLVRAHFD